MIRNQRSIKIQSQLNSVARVHLGDCLHSIAEDRSIDKLRASVTRPSMGPAVLEGPRLCEGLTRLNFEVVPECLMNLLHLVLNSHFLHFLNHGNDLYFFDLFIIHLFHNWLLNDDIFNYFFVLFHFFSYYLFRFE